VHQQQVPVIGDLDDELVKQARPRRGLRLPAVQARQLLEHPAAERMELQVELEEDVLLAGEVVVERCLGGAEAFGDIPQRRLVVALLGEQLERDLEDPFTRRGLGRSAHS
jgi:hypothetical protein